MIYLAGVSLLEAGTDGLIDRVMISDFKKKFKMRRSDAYTAMICAAAQGAVKDSLFSGALPEDAGIMIAGEFGPQNTVASFLDELLTYPENQVLSTAFSHSVHNAAASYVALQQNLTGPAFTLTGFENLCSASFEQAEIVLENADCARLLLVFAFEHSYVTELMRKYTDIPSEYAAAFLLSSVESESKYGTIRISGRNFGERERMGRAVEIAKTAMLSSRLESVSV